MNHSYHHECLDQKILFYLMSLVKYTKIDFSEID
jgi:hypothetical protein